MPRRFHPSAFALAALLMGLLSSPAAAQHCEVIDCFTAECVWVGPGHRRCRRVCQRRCWHAAAPRYELPVYAPGGAAQATLSEMGIDPGVLAALLAVAVIVVIGAISASAESAADDLQRETDAAHEGAREAAVLRDKALHMADDIDRHIAEQIAAAYERGRTSLPGDSR